MDNLRWQKGPLNNYKSLAYGKASTALSIYSLFLTPAEIHFARIFSHPNCVIPMTSTAPEKRLIVAVEGTAALGPYWRTIVNDYLEKIVRYFFLLFCLIEGIEKKKITFRIPCLLIWLWLRLKNWSKPAVALCNFYFRVFSLGYWFHLCIIH